MPAKPLTGSRLRILTMSITAAVSLALQACSSGSTPTGTLSSHTPSATPSATRTGPVPPASLGYTPGDPKGIGVQVIVASLPAATAEQQAAVQAWRTYWQASLHAYNTYGSSLATSAALTAFEGVSTGKARTSTLQAIGYQRQKKVHTVGVASFSVVSVQIAHDKAVIRGCVDDRTYEVDDKGNTTVPPPGKTPFADALLRSGTHWLVSDTPDVAGTC